MTIESDKLATKCNNTVRTADGKFIGLKETSEGLGECAVFRGIVYARYERFRLPEIVCYEGMANSDLAESCRLSEDTSSAYDATSYGNLCPQNLSHLERLLGKNAGLKIEEGKLCLSVTVPCAVPDGRDFGGECLMDCNSGTSEGEKLPVMVWIHGGSYLTGGSEDHRYDVCELALRGKVVVVKISYRLGALGYLWLDGLRDDGTASGLKDNVSGNLGLEDQKTALRWVRRHISSFGGDPENITVFGQSAGAHSIASVISSADSLESGTDFPLFGGEVLFHKAILQSAPLGITITPSEASRVTRRFLRELALLDGGSNSCGAANEVFNSCLRGCVPLERILAVQDKIQHLRLGMTFMPVLSDNMRIPEVAEREGVYSLGAEYHPIKETEKGRKNAADGRFAVVLGFNKDDASPYSRKALGPLWRTPLRYPMTKILTDRVFSRPIRCYVKRMKEAGIDVYGYCFRWAPKESSLGCCHSIELPFLLGHYDDWLTAEMLQGMTRKEFIDNRFSFQGLWTEFAHTAKAFENVCIGDSDSIDFISMKF